VTKIELKLKMLQLLSPARVSVVSQFENNKCLSLDCKLRGINLLSAESQN